MMLRTLDGVTFQLRGLLGNASEWDDRTMRAQFLMSISITASSLSGLFQHGFVKPRMAKDSLSPSLLSTTNKGRGKYNIMA